MKLSDIFSKTYFKAIGLVLAGLVLGWLFFHQSPAAITTDTEAEHTHTESEKTIWTCSMHPQIRMDKPGLCPICAMDLIPLVSADAEIDDDALEMSESAMKLAEVETSIVSRSDASKEVSLYGKIQPDERRLQSQTAHVPGRIEQLFINVTGESVKKGQLIARIYSPELITAQKELLEAVSMGGKYPAVPEAAREKLHNWKLSDTQIQYIEASGKIITNFDVFANTSGIVTSRNVNEGDYVSRGSVLFAVADLSRVWAVFDAYESDLPWISLGQKVSFTSRAIPGKTFENRVSFIDPVIDPVARIARVRVELANEGMSLKPGMFINGTLISKPANKEDQLSIPASAVLWTGTRSIVYVKLPGTEHPTFKMREITLGAAMNHAYIVRDGLEEGEEIVTHGTFSVDASAQLAGKTSMMNQNGEKISSGHDMSKMTSGEAAAKKKTASGSPKEQVMTNQEDHAQFSVSGNCEMCKERIEEAAGGVPGVHKAVWDIKTKIMHINFDKNKTSLLAVQKAIAAAGHDNGKQKAPDGVYNTLPSCCLYRTK